MTQVKDSNKRRSNYPEEEIKEAIACVCWAREAETGPTEPPFSIEINSLKIR